MKASKLIEQLKAVDVPFDAELTDSEFGPLTKNLVDIQHGAPFIVLKFGDGAAIKASEAIAKLEELSSEAPFDPTITNARLGDNHKELHKIYHEPPVTILEFH
tara:strand:- start:23231 stop:23539 length:309 start_codon:yes stop_codon:yes gene_type:complete